MAHSSDRIVHGLRSAGLTVDVAHLSPRWKAAAEIRRNGGREFRCPVEDDPAHALNLLWLRLAAGEPRHGAVVAFGGTLPLLAGPAFAAWLDVPLLVLLRGNDFDTGVLSPRRLPVLDRALDAAAAVCVQTRDHRRRLSALRPRLPVHRVPNGIDPAPWEPLPSDREAARAWRRATVAPGRRVLGAVGHLKAKKGTGLLVEALAAPALAGRFHLHLVGEREPALDAALAAAGDAVPHTAAEFVARPALPRIYGALDLVALPSFYDGMPNVLLEAGVAGVPVVAARCGGMADLVEDGVHGFLFPPGDAAACGRALDRAARATDGELAAMGEALGARVRAECGAAAETARYREVLASVAAAVVPAAGAPAEDVPSGAPGRGT